MEKTGKKGGTEFAVRTDLALEERERCPGGDETISGVSLREWQEGDGRIHLTEVKILDRQGERAMGKPMGTYLTLEADQLARKDEDYHREVSGELAKQIRNRILEMPGTKPDTGGWKDSRKPDNSRDLPCSNILVVGLGNAQVTADALGPKTAGQLRVTRHLDVRCGERSGYGSGLPRLSALAPGVMAQTGMETAEILRGVIRETTPDLLIVIDALAARSIRRLGTTIQLTDTGIHPGSGVGNHRHSLTKESLGIPVLAIGVPTVVGAAAIVYDTADALAEALCADTRLKNLGRYVREIKAEERYQLIRELLEPEFGNFYVTPPNIDELVGYLSFTISEGIHEAVFGNRGVCSDPS
ncbi:MAG: GPR endopeptidase [Clostridiales bacterium]|nr:GPR endopeptidase [Clostridiales bacterium]